MKKILLLAAAALMVTSASAQLKRSETTQVPARPQMQLFKPEAKMEVMQKRIPGTPVIKKAPNKAGQIDVWYSRPAGAFTTAVIVEDGAYAGMYYAPYVVMTPYVDYTFNGYVTGQSPDATMDWDVQYTTINDEGTEEITVWDRNIPGQNLTWQYGYELDSVPIFRVREGEKKYEWYMRGHEMTGSSDKPEIVATHSSDILAVPSTMAIWDVDMLKSSKTFCYGGRNGDQRYPMTYYRGAEPWGRNEYGWWFGKNGYHQKSDSEIFIDGIAQAFEKPTFPYLLNQVVLDCAVLTVKPNTTVDMHCRIYKLDEIPAYVDGEEVMLPEEPGELIAQGKATLTPETSEQTGDLVFFTLYDEYEGLQYDITPTIDCAILVVIDGYNDPEMDNLIDFSAMICSDDMVDEGFGELAYLKFSYADENGEPMGYSWNGLNNFFSSGEMKTGFSIFLSTENPYLTYNYNDEDGEYTFSKEGGVMEKHFGSYTTRSIEFWAWTPSEDDGWYMHCGDEDVPSWLNIELSDDIRNGEFSGLVNALVTAEPLPDGMTYREAVVRFEFPGAYIDYKFMQGQKQGGLLGDVNGDGEVSIADVNALVDIILGAEVDEDTMKRADVNEDGEIGIADVNFLLTLI